MSRLLAALGAAAVVLGVALVLLPPSAPEPRPSLAATTTAPAASTAAPPPSATALPPIPPGYRVQIPRLGIDLAILEGDVERDVVQLRTPENYAFHLPGTAIPGAGANAYLYAHARRGMFLSLWDARVGDEVFISTPEGRALRYVVSEVHSAVPPGDVSWAAASPPERLTLQTSTGPNPEDPRFVVVARPG